MSNALGTLATGVVIQRSLEMVFVRYPVLKQISLDLSNEEVAWNQAVNSRYQAIATVNDFGTGSVDRADTNVAVTINAFKEVHASFTPQEYTGAPNRNLVDESATPMAEAIGAHLLSAVAGNTSGPIAGIWTNSNFSGESVGGFGGANASAADTSYADIVAERKAFNLAGIPDVDRFMVVNSTVYASLLNDSSIIEKQKNNVADNTISRGMLTNVAGFNIYEWPNLPLTGSSVTNARVGFGGVKQSTVFAGRIPKDPRSVLPNAQFPGNIGVVTDPGSGLSVMVNEWIDPATLKANIRLIFMYGVAVGHASCGRVLKATAA